MRLKSDYIKFLMGGKTYEEVSEIAGVSRSWLNTVINRGTASMRTVNKIAKALNVEPIKIVELEE